MNETEAEEGRLFGGKIDNVVFQFHQRHGPLIGGIRLDGSMSV